MPMVVFDPRLKRQARTAAQMALNIDIAPTFLDLAGVPLPKGMQGTSLMPLVRGKKPRWRNDFFCEHLMVDPTIPQWEGVRGERYVYARYFGQKPQFEFLHDLKSDPKEIENLAQNPSSATQLAKSQKRLSELKGKYGGDYK